MLQFLCQPNVGDPESLKQGLKNIIPHAFGEHTCCNVSWCGFKQNPVAYKHTDLPNGKDLFGDSLKKALTDILDEYSTDIVVKNWPHVLIHREMKVLIAPLVLRIPKLVFMEAVKAMIFE